MSFLITHETPAEHADHRLLAAFYEAFSRYDLDAAAATVSAGWRDLPHDSDATGPSVLAPIFDAMSRSFPDLALTIDEIVGDAGRYAVRAHFDATHVADFFGIAARGMRVRVALHDFHHVENGRITTTWHLEDWFGLLQQVGASPNADERSARS